MRLLRHDDPNFAAALRSLNRRAAPAAHVEQTVAGIIAEVRATGDAALWALNERFSRPVRTPDTSLRVDLTGQRRKSRQRIFPLPRRLTQRNVPCANPSL